MSTTAQEQQQTLNPDASAQPAQAPAAPAEAQTPKSTSRSYTLFEEARQDTWTKIKEVEADSEAEALDSLGERKLGEQGKRFMAIPSRYVRPRKPKVDTVTTISYE